LRRSGNLWCAVGFHAAYDWGQTLFGVPDSGMAPYHHLFNSVFSGPWWLTGGIVGPEASVLTPIALALVALVFSRYYRENRYPLHRTPLMPDALVTAEPPVLSSAMSTQLQIDSLAGRRS
jgi:hypothetical protein